jgi:hypothetical protein
MKDFIDLVMSTSKLQQGTQNFSVSACCFVELNMQHVQLRNCLDSELGIVSIARFSVYYPSSLT